MMYISATAALYSEMYSFGMATFIWNGVGYLVLLDTC